MNELDDEPWGPIPWPFHLIALCLIAASAAGAIWLLKYLYRLIFG